MLKIVPEPLTYLLASNNNGDLERKLLLEPRDGGVQALSLLAALGEVLLHPTSASVLPVTSPHEPVQPTLGSLKTPGVLNAANEARPLFCCALAAERNAWRLTLVNETEDIVDDGRSAGYHKRKSKKRQVDSNTRVCRE